MSHSGSAGHGEQDLAAKGGKQLRDPGDRSSKLFDLRFLIGGLFTLYGLMVGGAGLLDSASDLRKSGGLRINLWTGLGMLALGLFFLAWAYLRPVQAGEGSDQGADSDDRHDKKPGGGRKS
jgi:hypothetical protein